MSGPPRMSLHVGDYLKDTLPISRVSWEHHGIYLLALMITWNTPKCQLPNDPEWLAPRFGCSVEDYHQHVEPVLRTYFKCDGNFYRQKRQRQEYEFALRQSRLQSERRKARKEKQNEANRNGNPVEPESPSGSTPPAPALAPIERKKETSPNGEESTAPKPPSTGRPILSPDAAEIDLRQTVLNPMGKAWNRICGGAGLSKIRDAEGSRRAKMLKRWREDFRGDLSRWEAYCQAIAGSAFLTGDNDRGWKADFDWALQPANLTKIREGKYDNRGKPSGDETLRRHW